MKNILIIASLYGSKRVLGLAKYLPEFGWSPTIIAPPVSWQPTIISDKLPNIEGVRIIETDYHSIKEPIIKAGLSLSKIPSRIVGRILHLGGAIINYPDSYSGWRRFALQAGREVLDKGDIDAIMSICPVTSHIVASELKKEYPDLRWICDLPDLWSQNHNYAYGKVRRGMDTRLELKTLASADVLTTSSEPRAEQLRILHKGKKVVAITLGYDEKEYDTGDVPLTDKFTITYTGLIYPKRQNPEILLEALFNLIDNGKIDPDDCEIRMYGGYTTEHPVTKMHHELPVKWYGKVSHTEAVKAQKESQLLWLLDWNDPNELGVHPGKVFEYLGARRPIIATGGVRGNVVDELLKETGAGYHAVSVEEAEHALLRCYQEWKDKNEVRYLGTGNGRYTFREMTKKYVILFEKEVSQNE